MKVARVDVLVLLGAAHAAGGASLRRAWDSPSFDDQMMSKDMSAMEQFFQSAPKPSQSDDNNPTADGLLDSAQWPTRESWDSTLESVIAGAKGDPCSAPLLARARLSPYGFGAHLNQFANEVALAMYSGKPIALCAPSNVRDSWNQYFQDPGFARCDKCDWNSGPRRYHEMGMDVSDGQNGAIVDELKHYLYKKLFTLKSEGQEPVDAGLQSLDLSGNYVGVHIRRGDKSQEVPEVPLEKYAQTIRELCSKEGTNTVFMASDDESMHGLLQAELGSSYKVVEQPRLPAAVYQLRGDVARDMNPGSEVEDEEKGILVDTTALARSSAFVGTASSNLGRLVYFERSQGATSVSLDGSNGFLSMTQ